MEDKVAEVEVVELWVWLWLWVKVGSGRVKVMLGTMAKADIGSTSMMDVWLMSFDGSVGRFLEWDEYEDEDEVEEKMGKKRTSRGRSR